MYLSAKHKLATAFKLIWLNISVLSDVMPLSLLSVYYILLGNLIILCFLQRSLTTPATSDQQHSSLHLCSRHPRLELKLSLHKSPGSPAPQWATSPLTSLPSPMGSPLQSAATSSPTYSIAELSINLPTLNLCLIVRFWVLPGTTGLLPTAALLAPEFFHTYTVTLVTFEATLSGSFRNTTVHLFMPKSPQYTRVLM